MIWFILFKNQDGGWEPVLGGKTGFLSNCLSRLTLLICTAQMTLFSDALMTGLIQPTFPPHYPQKFQISELCLSTTVLLCLVHLYTCYTLAYNIIYHFTSLTSSLHFPLHQVATYHKIISQQLTDSSYLSYFIFRLNSEDSEN